MTGYYGCSNCRTIYETHEEAVECCNPPEESYEEITERENAVLDQQEHDWNRHEGKI